MPQLDPTPWFMIFFFSWMTFLIILPSKIMSHSFSKGLNTTAIKSFLSPSWNWPWL